MPDGEAGGGHAGCTERSVCREQNGVLSEDTELTHLEGLKGNHCISNGQFHNSLVFVLMLKSIS